MEKRTPFPAVFWAANSIEVMERFAYYGIYMGFGIYMASLGYSKEKLGIVQSIFLVFSYGIPVISGSFADRYGFKKVLIAAYLAYLPAILLLLRAKTFPEIALTMLTIGLAAGIFKPLISGTVRAVTDKTNKTLGFGIFYAMVNIGGTFGPICAGKLRAISWNYAFLAAAISIGFMFLITIFFYKEPPREPEGSTVGQKFREIYETLTDKKFAFFLLLLGFFFWLPFWAFFNMIALYVDSNLDTVRLYSNVEHVTGAWLGQLFSAVDEHGQRRLLGETISQTGWVIMIFQIFVSRITEKTKAIPTFLFGLATAAVGMVVIGGARILPPAFVFLGIALFAVGEMISSPRIQEYITWIAPKEKAGLYMGSNFLATAVGAFVSGWYTTLYGKFDAMGKPEYVWWTLAVHFVIGVFCIYLFTRFAGEFKELEA